MPHIFLDGEKVKVRLIQTDEGVVMVLDDHIQSSVCRLNTDGTLLLYSDVNKHLKRTKKQYYIKTVKEMDKLGY
jgi:predicted AlkP superfamily pyrophosphatase or phosphodiesterase